MGEHKQDDSMDLVFGDHTIKVPEIKIKTAPKAVPVQKEKPVIRLEVFLRIAGPKWDQMAGFKSYARKQKLGPRTVPEWKKIYQDFMNKPVK